MTNATEKCERCGQAIQSPYGMSLVLNAIGFHEETNEVVSVRRDALLCRTCLVIICACICGEEEKAEAELALSDDGNEAHAGS